MCSAALRRSDPPDEAGVHCSFRRGLSPTPWSGPCGLDAKALRSGSGEIFLSIYFSMAKLSFERSTAV